MKIIFGKMKKLFAFFKLVRWPNLLITALMMSLVCHSIMGVESSIGFTLLIISMVFVVAGGYVINDIFDSEIDAFNKPDKVIVGKIFTEKQCKVFYWSLTIIGLACSLAASIIICGRRFIPVFSFMPLLACLFYSYSSRYKREPVIGNLIVSLSVALAVFLPWISQILSMLGNEEMIMENQEWMRVTLRIVLIYTVFAFMMTLIREIVKDMEDVKGDGRFHCRTIPVVWGMNTAQIIVIALSFLTCLGVSITSDYLYKEFGFSITSYMLKASYFLLLGFGIAGNTYSLLNDKSKRTGKTFRVQSIAMKIIMLIGVLSMFFIK